MNVFHKDFIESLIFKLRTIDHLFTKHFLHQSKLENLEQIEVVNSTKTTKESGHQVRNDESSFAAKVSILT